MKKVMLFLFSLVCILSVKAQTNKEDIDLIQASYGKEKKALVAEFITPADPVKKEAFWSLYDEYETERKQLGKKRVELLQKYADSYSTLDAKTTDEIVKQTIDLQKSTDALIIKYYGKLKEKVGVKEAAQFYQLEGYLLSQIRMSILGNIPFIGQLQKTASTK